MKYRILPFSLFIFTTLFVTAQKKPNTAFAIVSSDNTRAGWMNIQEIDLSTGQVLRTIFDKGKTNFDLLDGTTRKKIKTDKVIGNDSRLNITPVTVQPETKAFSQETRSDNTPLSIGQAVAKQRVTIVSPTNNSQFTRYDNPTATMVAAAAYDARHNRIYFTPLRFGELRWLDLYEKGSSLNVYCLTGQQLSKAESGINDESVHVTRMVIASDGNGYALSNDANSFTSFTTGKKPVVKQLGVLQDDPSNNTESIHNRKNWGGDMIADASGNLYVIAASHAVFKIDVRKNMASYMGSIQGLPQNYTTNGAAIDNSGNLIVSSANSMEGYYKVNLENLTSEKQNMNNPLASCSDLATGYFAFERPSIESPLIADKGSGSTLSIYPNPVTNGNFRVGFTNNEFGQYSIQLMDLAGRIVSQKRVTVSMKGQTEQVRIDTKLANGPYMVRIVDGSKKIVSSGKLILE